jgi:plastocyanin
VKPVRTPLLLTAALAASPVWGATVNGRVELVEKSGKKANDLSEAVVFVDGVKARTRPARTTITMKGKTFIPHVVVVPVGGSVDFPNEDPIFHNVFSVSGENHFDLDLYKRPKSGTWTFNTPGIVRVYCNIHPQMSAVVIVRDNPYFTKVTPDGSFAIEDVPAGKYTLKAWHERGNEAAMDISVPVQGQVGAKLVLDASGFKRLPHKKKDGKDYAGDEKY